MLAPRLVSALLFSLAVGLFSACDTQVGDRCLSDTDCGFGFDCGEIDDNGVGSCACVLEEVCGAGAQLEGEALEEGDFEGSAPDALEAQGWEEETSPEEVETEDTIVFEP